MTIDLSKPEFWREARAVLWSGIMALALCLFLKIVTTDNFLNPLALIVFAGIWVAIHHFYAALRKRIGG